MTSSAAQDVDPQYAEILEGCLGAVAEEVEAVEEELAERGLDRPLDAEQGRVRDTGGSGFVYQWRLRQMPGPSEDGPRVRVDDAVRIRTEDGEALGFVAGFEKTSGRVRVAVGQWLGERPGRAELEFDPTWLLAALAEQLERMMAEPDDYHPDTVLRLFGRSYPEVDRREPSEEAVRDLNESQRDALARLLGSDVQYVWGPPGTGKTRLLGHAVSELAETEKVLVAATTNGAVDEAAEWIARALGSGAVEAGRVVRVGAEFSMTGDDELSLDAALERRLEAGAGGVKAELEELEDRLLGGSGGGVRGRTLRSRHRRLVAAARSEGDEDALSRLTHLNAEIGRETTRTLEEADVVLSTFARLAAWEELARLRFNSLVIDEASTAPLSYVALAAGQTSGRTVAVGDFQQLPAVVTSRGEKAERWLSRDLFREAGIVQDTVRGEISLPSENDQLCAMLVQQYRMAPQVRRLVSEIFYAGRLQDAPEVLDRPLPASSLVLLDTDSMDPSTERVEGSRANAVHVEAAVRFLQLAADQGYSDVGVVAPYRVQSKRIWKLARKRLGRAAPDDLEVSTIHRFQGREKRLVVFDTVDAPPGRSWFLNEGKNRDFPRLLNVALSRTRDMLVMVGTPDGLAETLPEDALLNRVLARVERDGVVVDARGIEDAGHLFEEIRAAG